MHSNSVQDMYHQCIYIYMSALSQLQIFSQLMQQSPELLSQLGITPETLRNEMSKLDNMEKMKVLVINQVGGITEDKATVGMAWGWW